MWTESRYGSAARIGLHRLLQAPEARRPEVGQERVEGLQACRVHDVEAAFALPPNVDQAGFGQDLEMLRYRLLGDVEVPADLSCRARLVADQSEHRLAAGLGQGTQHGLAAHVTKCDSRCMFNQVLTCTSLDLYILVAQVPLDQGD